MDEFLNKLIELLPYFSIPVISGIVGWGTNVLALKMTFYPIEFVGIRPIGWQGIIPSKAKKMAGISVDLMTGKLVDIEEVFSQLNPKRVAEDMAVGLEGLSKQIINEVMNAQSPILWKNLPQLTKDVIYLKVADDLPFIIEGVMSDLKANIVDLLDLKTLAVETLMEDKSLINEIFLNVGKNEFKFIEKSGFYFGFLFGLVQMAVFFFYDPWWMLPTFGIIVGYLTNYLALKLIFEPVEPKNIFGYKLQGAFLKRQNEVADEYAQIITKRILTTESIFEFILRGPTPEKMADIIKKHIDIFTDSLIGKSKKLVEFFAISKRMEYAKNIAQYRFIEELPIAIRDVFPYAEHALNIKNILSTKMSALSKPEFVGFLRPVFQEDETKLVIVGAILGGLAGLAQYFLFFN